MIATCIGCGCTDQLACWDDMLERPCHWERLDRDAGLGVCSCCGQHNERWDQNDRDIELNNLPDTHPLRNRPLIEIGAKYRHHLAVVWKIVEPTFAIAGNTFNELDDCWTRHDIWRATKL